MSHVATVDVEIKNLDWLAQACERLGLELVRDQKRFFAYRNRKGCDHVIRIAGLPDQEQLDKHSRAYEIGVTARKDGFPGYLLSFDLFNGGNGLKAIVGEKCRTLAKAYTEAATRATMAHARNNRFLAAQDLADGSRRLVFEMNQ